MMNIPSVYFRHFFFFCRLAMKFIMLNSEQQNAINNVISQDGHCLEQKNKL